MFPVYSVPKTKKSPKRFVSVIFFYVLLEAGRSDLLEVLQRAAVHEAVDDLLAERLKLRRIELRQLLARNREHVAFHLRLLRARGVQVEERIFQRAPARYFGKRAAGGHAPVYDDAHAVAHLFHKAEDVRGQKHGLALRPQLQQEVGHRLGRQHVQAVGGFVEDDDGRIVHHRHRQRDLLFHASGQVGHLRVLEAVDPETLEQRALARVARLRASRAAGST